MKIKKHSVKFIAWVLTFALMVMLIPPFPLTVSVADSNDWTLEADGLLTISSDAGMTNWSNNGSFSQSKEVKKVVIETGVTNIADSAFDWCSNIMSVTIPNTVSSIGFGAFNGCSSLVSLTIPTSVTNVEMVAFANCTSLQSLIFESVTPPTWGSSILAGSDNCSAIYVPSIAVTAYKNSLYLYGLDNLVKDIATADITIIKNPIDAIYVAGDMSAALTVEAISQSGDNSFSYQWYSNMVYDNTSGIAISGATSASYAPSTATVGVSYYYAVITNSLTSTASTTAQVIVNISPIGTGTGITVNNDGITHKTSADIQDAINTASNPVTVTGELTLPPNSASIALNIPDGKTVKWQAKLTGSATGATRFFRINGGGTFTVESGAKIEYDSGGGATLEVTGAKVEINGGTVTGRYPIWLDNAELTVNGNSIITANIGSQTQAIAANNNSMVFIKGGNISASGGSSSDTGVSLSNSSAVITGGSISATDTNAYAVNAAASVAVIKTGVTISGAFYTDTNSNGVILEWNGGASVYNAGTTNDLQIAAGTSAGSAFEWDKVGDKNGISYKRGTNEGFIEIPGVTVKTPHTITFDTNGGNTLTQTTATTNTDGKLTTLPTPTRTGYTFKGWFTTATGNTEVTTSTVFSDNDTIYAQWAINTYAVTFSVTGGNGTIAAKVDGAAITSGGTVEHGKSVIFTASPNTGYKVKEWKLNGSAVTETSNIYTLSSLTAAATVTVEFEAIKVTGVTLDESTLTLETGDTKTLSATIAPADALNKNVSWLSSDSTVATVSDGVVTAVGVGTATITVTTEDGNKTTTCTVTVSEKVIESADISVTIPTTGATPNTTATGAGNFTIGAVAWSPSDTAFIGGIAYTATVTLTANANYTFTGTTPANLKINGQAATVESNTGAAVTLSFTFPHAHEWSATWESDGTHHWKKCTSCTEVNGKAAHSGTDDGNCTTAVRCTACNYVITTAKTHSSSGYNGNCNTAVICSRSGCNRVALAAQSGHTADTDDNDCTTAVICSMSGCTQTAIAALSHSPSVYNGNCNTAVPCTNTGCNENALAAQTGHTAGADDGNCTTAVLCSQSGCTQTATAAKSHAPTSYNGNCNTAVTCTNTGCTKNALPARTSHTAGADDNNCTTAVKCSRSGCTQTAIAAKSSHTLGSWIIDTFPTETTEGAKHKECAYCQYRQNKVMSAYGSNLCISLINPTENGGWLEIHNPTETAFSTKGLYLTNDNNKYKWQMPCVIIRPGVTVRICANSNNTDKVLKRLLTNFDMAEGETVRLIGNDGSVMSSYEVD